MGRVTLKRVPDNGGGTPSCKGCHFHVRPRNGQKGYCNKRRLRSDGHNLRDLYDCDDFRCEEDNNSYIFIKINNLKNN